MKNRLLLLLSLALVAMTASAITLYVSDHTFTNTSGTQSFTTSNGGTVTYDGSNKILTLNNVKIERSGSSKNCINNVDVSGLKINCTGTNVMIAANADAIICGAATTINVTSGQTSAASSASGQCGLQTYGANVTVTGSGRMLFTASNGYAVKGNSGNENITFQIKESTITGSRGCLNNFNRVTINPVSTSTTLSTTITLAATNNSSYNQVNNVSNWTMGSGVHFQSPTGTSFSSSSKSLVNSNYSIYNYNVVISDERDDPSATKVGNFLYKTGTFNGEPIAALQGATIAFKNTTPTAITVPGYVYISGTYYPVGINANAFTGTEFANVATVHVNYGVRYISDGAFAGCKNMTAIYLPSSLNSLGNYILGTGNSSKTLSIFWATLKPANTSFSSLAFSSNQSTKKVYFPTLPAIDLAKDMSSITIYLTVQTDPAPTACADLSSSGNYYIATKEPTSSATGLMTMVGCTNNNITINSTNGAVKAENGVYLYCTGIAHKAFYKSTNKNSLTINLNTFQSIGEYAFYGSTLLSSVNITGPSDNSMNIYRDAFHNCSALSTVYLKGVGDINAWGFEKCAISSLTLTEGIKAIGMGAFVGNTPLETIDLPASVNYFEGSAVSDCINLKSINVASGNTNYSSYDGCLYDKAQTTLIRVPEGYGGWDNSGFYGDTRYKSYPEGIPTTLKAIGDYALQNLQNITRIFIPYGVTTIENSAFEYCIKLTYIHIPSSVSSFDTDYAFKGCSALDVINIGKCNPNDAPFTVDASTFEGVPSSCKIRLPIDGVAACKKADYWKNFTITGGGFDFRLWEYDGAVTNKIYYPYRVDDGKLYLCKAIVFSDNDNALYNKLIDYVIPSSATYNGKTYRVVGLDQQCCKGNEHIQKVIMPSTITELKGICDANYVDDLDEGQQFYGCSSLYDIEFSPNIKKIPNSFAEGAHLNWLYLPYGVEDIGHSAFANNTAIQSILIPSSVTHMWANAIYGCSSLKWISTNVEPNVATEAAGTTACGFEGIPKTCRVYVPLGLADKYRNSKISDSQMHWNYFNPDSIQEGAYDIAGNGIAITVTKASTATTMGEGRVVYRPNYTLTTAELGSVIKDYFNRSYRITALSDSCFAGTSTLSEVTFDSSWNGKLATIPRHAFQRTNALKTFPWADSHMSDLKTIESGAFVEGYLEGEHDLSSLTKLTTIEDKAFFNNLIETMKLPSSLTYIGNKGMGDMIKLKTLVCDNPTPANLGSDVWYNVNQGRVTLKVPKGKVNAYKAAAQWKNFYIVENTGDVLLGDCNGDGEVNVQDVTALITYILGTTPPGFVVENANVNQDPDGTIDVQDVTALINMILE